MANKLKNFSKKEAVSLIVIFCVLVIVAIPNFVASLRRARDQVRRDDMGTIVHALTQYLSEFGVFPTSSNDGKIMNCLRPGDKPYQDKKGRWIVDAIPCEWSKDSFTNLISGKSYINVLPRDPNWEKGASYIYISDGASYQLFATMEGKNEDEVDPEVIVMNLSCGSNICNVVRSYKCNIPKTVEQCAEEARLLEK